MEVNTMLGTHKLSFEDTENMFLVFLWMLCALASVMILIIPLYNSGQRQTLAFKQGSNFPI